MPSRLVLRSGCLRLLRSGPAQAQSYPTKPITIVVPAAPGGVSDVMARLVAQRFTTAWGQQVIVENRGGANHAIGAAMVGKAAPDGHSMMVGAETVFVINPTLHAGKLPYDVADFAPITGLVRINQGLLAHPSLPANNIAELIALAKQKPGEITYGSSGLGAAGHVNVALLESMAGIKLAPVHYRGATPALNDVLAGHIMLTSVSLSASVPPYRAGKAKMLAVGSLQRRPRAARGAGHRRDRARLRGRHLVRAVHHRRHAARDHRQDQRRGADAVRRSGVPGPRHRPQHVRVDGKLARAVRRIHQGRQREMVEGAARSQHQGRLETAASRSNAS